MYRTIYILVIVLLLFSSICADTLTVSCGASGDDAWYDYLGAFLTTTTVPYMGFLGTSQMKMYLRFDNVTIPQGAIIDTALIVMRCAATVTNQPDQTFWCEDTSDAATYSAMADTGRTKTTASVNVTSWDNQTESVWDTLGNPDVNFKDIVQEVIDRGDWASGNAIAIATNNNDGSTNYLRWYHYDSGPGSYPPRLYLSWHVPSGVPSVRHSSDGNGIRHSPDGASVRHGG